MRQHFVQRLLTNLIVLPRKRSRERCLKLGKILCLLCRRNSHPHLKQTRQNRQDRCIKVIVSQGLRPVDINLEQGRHDLSVASQISKSNVRTPQALSPLKPTIKNRQAQPILESTSSMTKVRTRSSSVRGRRLKPRRKKRSMNSPNAHSNPS